MPIIGLSGPAVGAAFLLFVGAFIWGSAFVAQRLGAETVPPFTFLCARSVLGCLVLLPFLLLRKKTFGAPLPGSSSDDSFRISWRRLSGGVLCGLALFGASALQQIGVGGTTAGKAGFLTAFYIVFVPLANTLLFRQKSGIFLWCAVALALAGLWFLSMRPGEGLTLSRGDVFVLLCAVVYSAQILLIDRYKDIDGVLLSFLQFAVCSAASGLVACLCESCPCSALLGVWKAIAWCGVMSSGVAYTFQILAQKHLRPGVAALLMSLESVFAALTGWLILHESMTFREILGCCIVFAAVLLAQVPVKEPQKQEISDK